MKRSKSRSGLSFETTNVDTDNSDTSTSSEDSFFLDPEVNRKYRQSPSNEAQVKMANTNEELLEFLKKNFGEILSTKESQAAIQKANESTLAAITTRQDTIEKKQGETDKKIINLESQNHFLATKVDRLEQNSRNDTLRISGLEEDESDETSTKDLALKFIRDTLEVTMHDNEIHTSYRLPRRPKKDGQVDTSSPKQMIIKFKSESEKKKVYNTRIKLKDKIGMKDIYINEDLTLARSQLAYRARAAKKSGAFHSTWTQDGEVYAKKGSKLHTNKDHVRQRS